MMGSNKGGRPRSQDPLCVTFAVRFTRAEASQIRGDLDRAGMGFSEAVRLFFLRGNLPKKVYGGIDPGASEAYQNLAPLQSNVNQIAFWLNSTRPDRIPHDKLVALAAAVKKTAVEIRALRHDLITRGARE